MVHLYSGCSFPVCRSTSVRPYVCLSVCMYVCISVCMHVCICMYVCMYRMDVHECMDGWMNVWMDGNCIHTRMHARPSICACVCVRAYSM